MKGILLDVGYDDIEEGKVALQLTVKTAKGIEVLSEKNFEPYFYLATKSPKEAIESLAGAKHIEVMPENLLKVFAHQPRQVNELREKAKQYGQIREFDIPFIQRYLIDKGIQPMKMQEWGEKDGSVETKPLQEKPPEITRAAFDLETYNADGMSDPKKDKILMISVVSKEKKVFTWKKCDLPFVEVLEDEKAMIERFFEYITDFDVLYTYNGDNFDLPYLKERIKGLEIEDAPKITLRAGQRGQKAIMRSHVHLDAYKGMRFLATIGALRLPRYTLEDVFKEFTGEEKKDVEGKNIYKIWDSGDIEDLCEYCKQDSEACYFLGEKMLSLYKEFSKLINQTLFDVSRMSSGQIVELLLLKESFERKEIAPNRPGEGEVKKRFMQPIQGAFVKEPESGLHDGIAIMDFKGLYPSIIISHNISPDTLNCTCCRKPVKAPTGAKFCTKKKGIIPDMLQKVVDKRMETKQRMKQAEAEEYERLYNQQLALKIIANSTYGYMLFARARWYNRSCGESVTAWGRQYVHDAIDKAEKAGFKVIYGDTDSVFLVMGKKSDEHVIAFLKEYNKSLPEAMELELEGFYTRGIFVTKKTGGAAKKRYALIRRDGAVEITGLEFVRSDWSPLAKKTQEKVIRAVLENRVEDAKKTVSEVIANVREGKVPLEEFVVYTTLKRKIEKYEAIGPHVKAAMRLRDSGERVGKGTSFGYVITRGAGKNIGDRAYPIGLVGKREPDAEYYIGHQILPAVMKILRELGINEDDLKLGGKQKSIGDFF